MQMQSHNDHQTFPVQSMRLLDGETEAEKAAREAAAEAKRVADEAAAKAATEAAAKEKADAEAAVKAAEEAEAKRIADEKKAGKLTDKEYEFLTDALKHKKTAREAQQKADELVERVKAFEGLDAAAVKKLVKDQAAAEKAAKDAELKAAEAAGDVERIKKMMGEEHNKVVSELQAKLDELNGVVKTKDTTIEDLTVGSAFSQSTYIANELVLTPQIARTVYSGHFDVVNGKVVPFDKSRGEAGRTQLVNATGAALSVDEALKKIVEASPDRDRLVRSKIAAGAGSKTEKGGTTTTEGDGLRGMARITAALEAGALKKKPGAK
jgi:hypothetical protein